ncbi:MAG: Magnesium and cobalt efflux protein CorC [Syntrophorhabdaceae bacterium PtaU1.Bin034]|nr:MAG: Magnesium and cobalt efflux protein CorC [Syntrophorhabdaceae bacterium PtaU1.Bin034]
MSTIWMEIAVVMILVFLNGVFAMSEIAVVSARKARLQQAVNEGKVKATVALELANAPGSFLSTIQIGITLIGILAGAYSGATIATVLSSYFAGIPSIAPYRETISLGIVVIVITYLSLIIGELVPKRIALNNPERIAMNVAKPMRTLSSITLPVVHLLNLSTSAVLAILRIKPSEEPPVTEEEVKILIDQGTRSGVFEEMEQDMVESIFRLTDRKVNAVMTPRPDIVSLDLDDPPEENWRKMSQSGHSVFPVHKESEDNVVGIASIKTLWAKISAGRPIDLKSSLSKPLFVPENMPAFKLLSVLKQSGMHMALVVDEYGDIQGLATPQDIFKSIVGDLASIQPEPSYAVRREDGSWLVDGMIPIDEFKELLQIGDMPDREENGFNTLAGFVVTQMGRIPEPADHFELSGFRFEVLDMDGPRVDKVLVVPLTGKS